MGDMNVLNYEINSFNKKIDSQVYFLMEPVPQFFCCCCFIANMWNLKKCMQKKKKTEEEKSDPHLIFELFQPLAIR